MQFKLPVNSLFSWFSLLSAGGTLGLQHVLPCLAEDFLYNLKTAFRISSKEHSNLARNHITAKGDLVTSERRRWGDLTVTCDFTSPQADLAGCTGIPCAP